MNEALLLAMTAAGGGGGGGGGYTEAVIADDTITLTGVPFEGEITFVEGANPYTPIAWTSVKVDGINLTYDNEQHIFTAIENNIQYVIYTMFSGDGKPGSSGLFVGNVETHEPITGTYSVEIKALPSLCIVSNTQTDVKDYAAVTTYYVPNPAYRNVTINNNASSTSYFSYVITYVNPNADNAVVNASAGASILAGGSESYRLFVDGNESASPIILYTGSTKKLTVTGVGSSFIHYSNDKTMAWVYVAQDNTTISVKVTNS